MNNTQRFRQEFPHLPSIPNSAINEAEAIFFARELYPFFMDGLPRILRRREKTEHNPPDPFYSRFSKRIVEWEIGVTQEYDVLVSPNITEYEKAQEKSFLERLQYLIDPRSF